MIRKNILIILSICIAGTALLALRSGRNTSSQCTEEKPLVIIVPSYNNSEWVDKNLRSIFSQQYNNYRIIYIDDCSSDNTYELVKNYIEQHGLTGRVTLIRNSYRHGAMANHFMASHMCKDDEIIVHLDGDDWFKHDYVLQKVNQIYSDPNVWMTYGQYEVYPGGRIGFCREFPAIVHEKNIYREYEWISAHLRTFYAWLFKRIAVKDFLYHGTWFSVNYDRPIMYALLEMTREHCRFIPDVLYVYNCARPENDHKQHLLLQWHCNNVICSRAKYAQVKQAPDFTKHNNDEQPIINMIIFSDDHPMLAQAVLESSYQQLSGIHHATLLYHASNDNFKKAYINLEKRFEKVSFHEYQRGEKSNLARIMSQLLSQTEYVMFAHDGIIIKEPIDLQHCIQVMKKTHAFGFYLTLGQNIRTHPNLLRQQKLPPFIDIENTISAWQFECGEYDWKKPHTISLALYNAHKVKNALSNVIYDSPRVLEELWARVPFDMTHVGLIYNQSPAIIFDEMIAPSTSLTLFEQGLKLDISTVAGITNQSVHVSKEIPLIS